ncbi:hypothetical protein PG984_002565 [Apiospora sp. TS-2023a]
MDEEGKATKTPQKRRQSQLLPLSAEKGNQHKAKSAENARKRQRRDENNAELKKTTAASKKRRQNQLFPFDEKDSRDNALSKGEAPKRQCRDDKPTVKTTDPVQVDGREYRPFHLKRQRSRWTAVNIIRLEEHDDDDENVDRVTGAVSGFHFGPSQSKTSSSSASSQEQSNDDSLEDDENNTTHKFQEKLKTQQEKEDEEDQFYYDHAYRSTRDYGRPMTVTTPNKHTGNSPRKSSGDKGGVWAAFVEPLVREDTEHNLQLKERLEEKRRAREEQFEAEKREEAQEEKKRIAREKARERRQRKKEEKEKEEQEMQDQGVDGAAESTSVSPDWLRLEQGTT